MSVTLHTLVAEAALLYRTSPTHAVELLNEYTAHLTPLFAEQFIEAVRVEAMKALK